VIRVASSRILSPTAINTYLSCPRKFYLRYIKKLGTRPSIHLVRGNIIHKVLCRYNRLPEQSRAVMDPLSLHLTLLKSFEEEWEKASAQLRTLHLPEATLEEFRDESQLMVIHFAFWIERHQLSPAKRAEVRLVSKAHKLMGIVDAIHGAGADTVLVDYKTSKRAEITHEIQRQAALYALLHHDMFGRAPGEVWIHFLKFDESPLVIHVDEELVDYARIVTQSVHEKTQSQDEQDYPCTCGGWCAKEFIPK